MTQVWYIAGITLAAAGAALAAWSLLIAGRARGRVRCPGKGSGPLRRGCWYDLSGSPPDPEGVTTCPECGRRITRRKDMLRTRRLWKPAAGGLAAVAAGVAVWAGPMLRADDWHRAAPSTLLVAFADPAAPPRDDPVWAELERRMQRGRLAQWHRRTLSDKLADMLERNDLGGSDLMRVLGLTISLHTGTPALQRSLAGLLERRADPPPPPRLDGPMANPRSWQLASAVRRQSIRAVIAARATQALPTLRQIASDPADSAADSAAFALLAFGDEPGAPLGVELLQQRRVNPAGPEPSITPEILGLALFGTQQDHAAIRRFAALEGREEVMNWLLSAATQTKQPFAEALVSTADTHRQWENIGPVLHVLWLIDQHASALPALRTVAAGTADPIIRLNAMMAAAAMGADQPQTLQLLRQLRDDDDPRIAYWARYHLDRLDD